MDKIQTALSIIMNRKSVRNFIPGKEISHCRLGNHSKSYCNSPF
jgi:hypothetical protein